MKKILMIIPLVLLLCFAFSCQQPVEETEIGEEITMADIEAENKAIVRYFIEELDKGNFDIHKELFADSYVCHFGGIPEPLAREGQEQFMRAYYEAFPDNTHAIEDIIAKGDKVVLRQINRATQ